MDTKAKRTTQFIVKTVAPIFIKQGYVGTSMSHLTAATGLTKGAIYGNFKNKETLALAAFEFSTNQLLNKFDELLSAEKNALDKIYSLINFYSNYDVFAMPLGGCPIISVGVDTQHNNKLLATACKEIIRKLESKIALVLEDGIHAGEIKIPVPPHQFAKQLYTMLNGAVCMATIIRDRAYLQKTTAYISYLIKKEIKS